MDANLKKRSNIGFFINHENFEKRTFPYKLLHMVQISFVSKVFSHLNYFILYVFSNISFVYISAQNNIHLCRLNTFINKYISETLICYYYYSTFQQNQGFILT